MKRFQSTLSISGIAALALVMAPLQTPAQMISGWPVGTVQPIVQGPDLASTMRNAIQATSDQARLIIQSSTEIGRRARSPGYLMQNLANDYQTLQFQFQNLRATFNVVGELVVQLQSARAANSFAELDSALNIISEAFLPVQQESQTGAVKRDTFVRLCQVLGEAMIEWQKELKKDSSRLGVFR